MVSSFWKCYYGCLFVVESTHLCIEFCVPAVIMKNPLLCGVHVMLLNSLNDGNTINQHQSKSLLKILKKLRIQLGFEPSVWCTCSCSQGWAFSVLLLLVSRAIPPSHTAGTIFLYIYISDDLAPRINYVLHVGPARPRDCPRATHKRNQPCLFHSPSMPTSICDVCLECG